VTVAAYGSRNTARPIPPRDPACLHSRALRRSLAYPGRKMPLEQGKDLSELLIYSWEIPAKRLAERDDEP
jgi:hypothetical protein